MKFVHRITVSSSPEIRAELAGMGIAPGTGGLLTFEIDESHNSWPKLSHWIPAWKAVDIVRTEFTSPEIANSSWLELTPDWHWGYPQPEEDLEYLQSTYDTTDYCPQCGVGAKQTAPFQVKGDPKWGRRSILQLNWVFDEYFVTPDTWSKVFKPHGIEKLPVVDRKGSELRTIVQLSVNDECSMVTEGLPGAKCSKCGRMKYLPVVRGPFPALASKPKAQMSRTTEHFGSGASGSSGVVLAQDLARALSAGNVRGASLRPVADRLRSYS